MQRVALRLHRTGSRCSGSLASVLIICATSAASRLVWRLCKTTQQGAAQDCTASKAMPMPRYRGPQLLLWACTAAALQAPAPPRKSLITTKAATEGAEIPYELCCQALHDDEAARLAAPPEDILKARYSAYTERKPDFIIDTTHPSNEEYDDDREAWRARILDFAAAAKFLQLVIYDSVPIDEATHSITWNARIKVLDGLVDERLVETKDFIERSLFVKEDGRWLYLKGDPDFEPRNVRVDGPLDPKPKPPKRRSTAKKPAVSRSRSPVSR